jgi:hypothetical protein
MFFVDPYPGTIEVVQWEGGRLKVKSDRPLAAGLDALGRAPGMEIMPEPRPYWIDLAAQKVEGE